MGRESAEIAQTVLKNASGKSSGILASEPDTDGRGPGFRSASNGVEVPRQPPRAWQVPGQEVSPQIGPLNLVAELVV
jgi:hypothetical protein